MGDSKLVLISRMRINTPDVLKRRRVSFRNFNISIPSISVHPYISIHLPCPLVFAPFSISRSASLLSLQIYYHPAGNITAVFIAARRRKRRSSYLPLPLSDSTNLGSLILSRRETRRETPRDRGQKLRGLLFRTDSRIGNQLYHCYNGASTAATDWGIRSIGCKDGMLKKAYFIALIMNEGLLSLPQRLQIRALDI